MNYDTAVLLVAVNGFVLAAFCFAVWLFLPVRRTAKNGPDGPDANQHDLPGIGPSLRDGLQSLAQRMSPAGTGAKLQQRLDLAGNPRGWNVSKVFAAKSAGLFGGVLFGVLFAAPVVASVFSLRGLLVAAGCAAFGFFLPNILLYNAGTKRQQRIRQDLPDTLDLMSVSMRAGLGFDAAVGRVAQNSHGPLAAEFARMLHEFRLGRTRQSVLRSLSARSNVPDLRYVVQALVQADTLGVPIATVLTEQGAEMRTKRRQRAEERAQKVTVKIVFPTLLCIFPALMITVIGPGVIKIMDAFGW
jgi:tight adherence protein C